MEGIIKETGLMGKCMGMEDYHWGVGMITMIMKVNFKMEKCMGKESI